MQHMGRFSTHWHKASYKENNRLSRANESRVTAQPSHIVNSILAQAGFALGTFNLVLYGVAAVVLLVVGILVFNFGMIYPRLVLRLLREHLTGRQAFVASLAFGPPRAFEP